MKVTRRFDAIGIGDIERAGFVEELGWFVSRGGEGEGVWNWLQGNMR